MLLEENLADLKNEQEEAKHEATATGSNDRELRSKLKQVEDQFEAQKSVNKNLALKVMVLEKQIQDEKKKRTVVDPAPAPKKYEGSDLSSVQQQLEDLKSRVYSR